MLLKYNVTSEITDNITTDIKWLLPNLITLTTDHLYQFNSVSVTKGTPYILTINTDPLYTLRYLVINSDNSFTYAINNGNEFLTNLFFLDVGPSRVGYTNLTNIQTVKLTNPTGNTTTTTGQFTNPNVIEVKFMLILEKLT